MSKWHIHQYYTYVSPLRTSWYLDDRDFDAHVWEANGYLEIGYKWRVRINDPDLSLIEAYVGSGYCTSREGALRAAEQCCKEAWT